MARFVVRKDGKIETFTKIEDIPETFDHLISFEPDYPVGPHTEDEHKLMSHYNNQLKMLMQRESIN